MTPSTRPPGTRGLSRLAVECIGADRTRKSARAPEAYPSAEGRLGLSLLPP
jgi:hypothetical protein